MTFRKIEVNEISKLSDLYTAYDMDALNAGRRFQIDSGMADIFVLEHDGNFIAEITIWYCNTDNDFDFAEKGKRGYLSALRVLPQFQRQGLAQLLSLSALNELRKLGYTEATIGVEDDNAAAKHIYNKLGFTTFVKRCKETFQVDTFEYDLLLKSLLVKQSQMLSARHSCCTVVVPIRLVPGMVVFNRQLAAPA